MRQTTRVYAYTLYREPGHEVVLQNASGRACAAWMQENENMLGFCCWKALRAKLLKGATEGYGMKIHSVLRDEVEDIGIRTQAERREHYMKIPEIPPMCGYCSRWAQADGGRKRGLRMGVCGATGRKTERCHMCDARKGKAWKR